MRLRAALGRKVFVVFDPRPLRGVVPEHSQAAPVFEFLLDVPCHRLGLKPKRMPTEIYLAAPRVVEGVMKFLRESGQRIARVERQRARRIESRADCVARRVPRRVPRRVASVAVRHLPGACMIVPQRVQVRCVRLE
jgi:hypothetical protein